jgi:hypothetical protein
MYFILVHSKSDVARRGGVFASDVAWASCPWSLLLLFLSFHNNNSNFNSEDMGKMPMLRLVHYCIRSFLVLRQVQTDAFVMFRDSQPEEPVHDLEQNV